MIMMKIKSKWHKKVSCKKNWNWRFKNLLRYKLNWKINKKNKVHTDFLEENHKEFIRNNELMLKLQERFRSDSLNVFPEKVNEIVLSANNNKGIQSID